MSLATKSSLALQSALFAALQADSGLSLLIGTSKVFDHVPRRTKFPYVSLGQAETSDWSTQDQRGAEHIITIDIWSNHRGKSQSYEIISRIDEVLDGTDLTLDGFNLVNLRVIFWTVMQEQDGKTFHGVMRLRAVTEPLS